MTNDEAKALARRLDDYASSAESGNNTAELVALLRQSAEALRSLSQQAETRIFGTEPRGCPTHGACSCPSVQRDLILALIEVARMPNIEYVADAHNDAVKKLRAMLAAAPTEQGAARPAPAEGGES